jgi:hypothetical protein
MNTHNTHLVHARALLADIQAAPDTYIPRREILTEWLSSFLVRAQAPRYDLGDTEVADLTALDQFLRGKHVATAGPT